GVPFMNNAGYGSGGVHAAEFKRQRIRLALHQDNMAWAYLLAQDPGGDRVFKLLFDEAAQRPRAVGVVIALVAEPFDGRLAHLQTNLLRPEALSQITQHQPSDALDVFSGQRTEDYNVIQAV
ncbi:MAG: hypothetical protein NTZ98_06565, partial [Acidobacteria bacterium]|nr:hypothetical protein [Acidobacteriota bacterium]